MSIHAVQGSPAQLQNDAPAAAAPKAAQQATASTLPQDRVTISSAAQAKAASGDKDHDGDSK
jgi:hypothetical protein